MNCPIGILRQKNYIIIALWYPIKHCITSTSLYKFQLIFLTKKKKTYLTKLLQNYFKLKNNDRSKTKIKKCFPVFRLPSFYWQIVALGETKSLNRQR